MFVFVIEFNNRKGKRGNRLFDDVRITAKTNADESVTTKYYCYRSEVFVGKSTEKRALISLDLVKLTKS